MQPHYGAPTEKRFVAGDVELAWFEWGRVGDPQILLLHAAGFHARCWDQVVAGLPTGYHVLALDMRGHGRSARVPPYVWDAFAGDVCAFISHVGMHDAVGVGHSMGGHCLVQAAARCPSAFRRLVLVDPVILAPDAYGRASFSELDGPEDHPVARRRNHWSSWREMRDAFADRLPYSLWRAAVLEDYCRHGVLPRAEGDGCELACPPLVEASVYFGGSRSSIHEVIGGISIPVVVMRAAGRVAGNSQLMDFVGSPTWEHLAGRFPRGRDVYLPELSHFIPMQQPELMARFIVDGGASC